MLAAVVGGCGGGGGSDVDKQDSLEGAVKEYFASNKDPQRRCAVMSSRSLDQYRGRDGCEERLAPSRFDAPTVIPQRAAEKGDRGCVRYRIEPGDAIAIAVLVRESGGWKVDRLESGIEPQDSVARTCRDDSSRERD